MPQRISSVMGGHSCKACCAHLSVSVQADLLFGHTSLLCEVHAAPSFAEIGYFRRVDKARQRNEIQSIHKEHTVSM